MSKAENFELMRKLKALADRGEGGERENARRLLNRLMDKYDVEEADLSDDVLEEHMFAYRNKHELTLLVQLFYKIAGDRKVYRYTSGKGKNSRVYAKCTKAEAVQVEVEYEFYRELWKEEVEWLMNAFIQKHRIFDIKPGHKTEEISDEEAERLGYLINGLKDASPLTQIED